MFGQKRLKEIESRLDYIETQLEVIQSFMRKIEQHLHYDTGYERMRKEFYHKLDEIKKNESAAKGHNSEN